MVWKDTLTAKSLILTDANAREEAAKPSQHLLEDGRERRREQDIPEAHRQQSDKQNNMGEPLTYVRFLH
jgi:hypothetical protein